jgi:hypothetical protein
MRKTIENSIRNFMDSLSKGRINIYNEMSLQHELGFFLRNTFQNKPDINIEFERPVNFFGFAIKDFVKKEIDICLYNAKNNEKYAIELKFPRNGQYPEQMFKACEDIMFLEQLREKGFNGGFFVMLADDDGFYSPKKDNERIYGFFRAGKTLTGNIQKPTGKKDSEVNIRGKYEVRWEGVKG